MSALAQVALACAGQTVCIHVLALVVALQAAARTTSQLCVACKRYCKFALASHKNKQLVIRSYMSAAYSFVDKLAVVTTLC
jgi:hypothetical protein